MNKLSSLSLVVCLLAMIYTGFIFYPKWDKPGTEATISWDASGYYMYLPAIFIYKDIKECKFRDSLLKNYGPTPDFQQATALKTGGYVMKYSSGQAILMSPFFALSHLYAINSKVYPADGFSKPYQMGLGIGMFLYSILGLYFFRKVFLNYFSDKVVAILLICLVFGTNYLNYASIDQAMTHSTLFTIYCILISVTIDFYKRYSTGRALMIGLLFGLATLIRPTEIISVLIPVFWGIKNLESLKGRFNFIKDHLKGGILAIIGFGLLVSIQLIYWKYSSGSWIFYSYDEQGFSFKHPHFKDYIFSYQTGWLRYCMMMYLPFVGLLVLNKVKRNIWPVILFFMFLNLYIVASWDVWTYGGRAMIQSYPIMFFPLAALIEYVQPRKIFRIIVYAFILFSIYINIWWTYHCHAGSVSLAYPTKAYYWKVLGRWKVEPNIARYLDNDEWYDGTITNEKVIYFNDFEKDTTQRVVEQGIEGRSIAVNPGAKYTMEYPIPNPPSDAKWLRVSADALINAKEYNGWEMGQMVLRFYMEDGSIKDAGARADRYIDANKTGNFYFDTRLDNKKFKKITFFIYNDYGSKTFIIDNLKIVAF